MGLPALAALMGIATLLHTWRSDESLRLDATAVAGALWRHRVTVLLGTAAILAMAIVALVVGHSVAHLPR